MKAVWGNGRVMWDWRCNVMRQNDQPEACFEDFSGAADSCAGHAQMGSEAGPQIVCAAMESSTSDLRPGAVEYFFSGGLRRRQRLYTIAFSVNLDKLVYAFYGVSGVCRGSKDGIFGAGSCNGGGGMIVLRSGRSRDQFACRDGTVDFCRTHEAQETAKRIKMGPSRLPRAIDLISRLSGPLRQSSRTSQLNLDEMALTVQAKIACARPAQALKVRLLPDCNGLHAQRVGASSEDKGGGQGCCGGGTLPHGAPGSRSAMPKGLLFICEPRAA
jgi:hypothetical protein